MEDRDLWDKLKPARDWLTASKTRAEAERAAKVAAKKLASRIAGGKFEPGRGYRAHYNLACYWTRVKDWNQAWTELKLALESGNIAAMANADPALAALKADNPAEWVRLVGRSDPATLPLAAITAIGPDVARALSDLGILGSDEFVNRSDTKDKRASVARALVVSPVAVEEWHDLLAMSNLLDLDPEVVNLLFAARVTSIGDLKKWTGHVAELSKVLAHANKPGTFVDTDLTDADLQTWISAATDPT